MFKPITNVVCVTLLTILMIISVTGCTATTEETPSDEITWSLKLTGASTKVITQEKFEEGANPDCHGTEVTIEDTGIYSGIPLWLLCGWVDDRVQHGDDAFNDELADSDYNITVIADDEYSAIFNSKTIARNNDIILANELDGQPIDKGGPLKLVGTELSKGQQVKNVVEIRLDLPE